MKKKLRLYFNDGYIDYKLLEAIKILKEFQTFSVFCAFIDPRTDTYIEASLPFFPNPQPAYPGRYFLSEYKGLAVKISCDFDWFATKQMDGVKRATVPYETSVISSGAYKQVSIKLEISTSIRIASDTPPESLAGDFIHYFKA